MKGLFSFIVGYTPFPCLFCFYAVGFNLSWLDRIALRDFLYGFVSLLLASPPFFFFLCCLTTCLEHWSLRCRGGWLATSVFSVRVLYGVTSSMRAGVWIGKKAA